MNDLKSPMENALAQFNEWLDSSGIDRHSLFTSATIIPNKKTDIKEYNQAIDIAKKLEQYNSIGKDFIDAIQDNFGINTQDKPLTQEVFLDINRKFGDLVKEGPKTSVEEKLLDTVNTFLSPQDKKQAVDQNFSVGAVVKLVEQSMQKSQELASQTLMREKQHEKEQEQKQIHKEPEKKMASLGEEYGVLNEIVKNMRKAFENEKTQLTDKRPDKTFKFETVSMDDVSKAFKDMGKDPNHSQDNSKSRSR